ncbi:MAG: hypothetical protein WD802_09770 [Gemmatimonadaceae bacterium]
MTSTRFLLAAMVLGTALGTNQANAQGSCIGLGSCNTTNTASVTVGALVKLGFSSTSTTLTAPDADDLDVGALIENAGPTFTVKANRSWTLKIKTTEPTNWQYSGTSSGVKPIGHLAWATSSGGTFTPITASDATFASGAGATNSGAASSFFQTTWVADFADPSNREGVYSLPIVFTLSAP